MAENVVKISTKTDTCETTMEWEMDRFVLVHLLVKSQPISSGNFTAVQDTSVFNLKLLQSKGAYELEKKFGNSQVVSLLLQLVSCPKNTVSHKFLCDIKFGGSPSRPFIKKYCQDFVVERCSKSLLEIPWTEFQTKLDSILHVNKLHISLKLIICIGDPKSTHTIDQQVTGQEEEKLIMASLDKLFKNLNYSDVTLVCGKTKLPAHKCILTGRSSVFEKMFETKMKESSKNVVKIKDIDGKIMKLALQYIYTGQLPDLTNLDSTSLISLVDCAEKYDLQGLKRMCIIKLFNSITDKTAGQLAMMAYLYNIEPPLKHKILSYCQSRHSTLIHNSEYKKLFYKTPQAFVN